MRHGDVVNLAWDVADAVATALPAGRRTAIFAGLGAGSVNEVLISLLHESVPGQRPLPPVLAERVRVWVDGHADPRDRQKLRMLLRRNTGAPVMANIRTPVRLVASRRPSQTTTDDNAMQAVAEPPRSAP